MVLEDLYLFSSDVAAKAREDYSVLKRRKSLQDKTPQSNADTGKFARQTKEHLVLWWKVYTYGRNDNKSFKIREEAIDMLKVSYMFTMMNLRLKSYKKCNWMFIGVLQLQ